MTPEQIEKLEEQAYAQIIWGDSKTDVIQFLLGKGVRREDAERIVKESLKDRAAEIRKEGVRNIWWGSLMLAGSLAGAFIYYANAPQVFSNRRSAKLMVLILLPGVYGTFKLLKGIPRVILGMESGSISSMD